MDIASSNSEDAIRISKFREHNNLSLIHSRNQLAYFIPYVLRYTAFVFTIASTVGYYNLCNGFPDYECKTARFFSQHRPTDIYSNMQYLLTGAHVASVCQVYIQIVETPRKELLWNARLYAMLAIGLVGSITSVIISLGLVPNHKNAFGQDVQLPRLIQWLSTTPSIVFMLFSLDIRGDDDVLLMYAAAVANQFCIIGGLIGNTTSNYTLAVIGNVIAPCSVVSMIVLCGVSFRRMSAIIHDGHDEPSEIADTSTVSNILKSEVNMGATLSFQLLFYSTFLWIAVAIVFFCGLFKVIPPEMEHLLHSFVDLGLLMRLLVLEERANAAFRQSLRFVFHEMSSPLSVLSTGVAMIHSEGLTDVGLEALEITKSNCSAIVTKLKEIQSLQAETIVVSEPFNFKDLVREVAKGQLAEAALFQVRMLLSIDASLPEVLLGDARRLKSVINCFILNGINQTKHPGGSCTVSVSSASVLPPVKDLIGIRFAVHDEGGADKLITNPIRLGQADMQSPPISLLQFKSIIERHGGIVGLDRKVGRGSKYYFEINFKVPSGATSVVENLSKLYKEIPNSSSENLTSYDYSKVKSSQRKRTSTVKQSTLPQQVLQQALKSSSLSSAAQVPKPQIVQPVYSPPASVGPTASAGPSADIQRDVLVVDDVLSNRRMTGRVLERMGYKVEEAEDGTVALDRCANRMKTLGPYAVIMMDNMMPKMTGKDATIQLRKFEYTGIIVGLTGNVLEEDLEEFSKAGCDEVITKPLDVMELKRTLQSLGLVLPNKDFK